LNNYIKNEIFRIYFFSIKKKSKILNFIIFHFQFMKKRIKTNQHKYYNSQNYIFLFFLIFFLLLLFSWFRKRILSWQTSFLNYNWLHIMMQFFLILFMDEHTSLSIVWPVPLQIFHFSSNDQQQCYSVDHLDLELITEPE